MSKFAELIQKIHGSETGLFFHDIASFTDGVSVSKKGIASMRVRISCDAIGAKHDARSFLPPYDNGNSLIPLLVFVDEKQLAEFVDRLP